VKITIEQVLVFRRVELLHVTEELSISYTVHDLIAYDIFTKML